MTPYFSATFSEVIPIGIMQFWVCGFSKTSSERRFGSTVVCMFPLLMLSHPPPIPTLIYPALIELAIVATAYRPDEQSLLIAWTEVVSGYPARNIAIRQFEAAEP